MDINRMHWGAPL